MHAAQRVEMALARHAAKHRAALRYFGQGKIQLEGNRRRRIFAVDDALQEFDAAVFEQVAKRNGAEAKRRHPAGIKFDFAHGILT
jgi:hypothetical protein